MANEYIERGSLPQKRERGFFLEDDFNAGWNACLYEIEKLPAVDAVEVRHGQWIASFTEHTFSDGTKARWNIWRCSRCPYERTAGWEYTREGQKPKGRYCENCGARMDGEEEHNGE